MNTSHMQLHLVLLNTEKGATVMPMVIFVTRCSPGVCYSNANCAAALEFAAVARIIKLKFLTRAHLLC